MNTKNTILCILALPMVVFFVACKKKQLEPELITTVKIDCKLGDSIVGSFVWSDPDGDGGNPPLTVDTIKIDSGVTYQCYLSFEDRSFTPLKNITEEIKDNGSDHMICFTAAGALLNIVYKDSDGKYGIGLISEWKPLSKGIGSLRLILRHQPGIKDGSCDPGESDVDVVFPLLVK